MSVRLYAADNGDHLKVLEQNNRITAVCGKLELGLLQNRRGQGDQTGSQEVSLDGHWHPWPEVYEGQMEEAFWHDHMIWPLTAVDGQEMGGARGITTFAAWVPGRMVGRWTARGNGRMRFGEKDEESPFELLESQPMSFLPKDHSPSLSKHVGPSFPPPTQNWAFTGQSNRKTKNKTGNQFSFPPHRSLMFTISMTKLIKGKYFPQEIFSG